MTPAEPTNMSASVHARLLNISRAGGEPFERTFQRYALERFLYRLSQSRYAESYVLKGALMLQVWGRSFARPTRDIDLLGRGTNEVGSVVAAVRNICATAVPPDGLVFDAASIEASLIAEESKYHGVRVTLWAFMGKARIRVRMDVGFGDAAYPPPERITYPTYLDFPAPVIFGYRPETSIAEKLHAMVTRGVRSSRLKDFYDLWAMGMQLAFDGQTLARSVDEAFARRGTTVPADFAALAAQLCAALAKQTQWDSFISKSGLTHAPAQFSDAMDAIELFLGPVVEALVEGREFTVTWTPPGPWVDGEE